MPIWICTTYQNILLAGIIANGRRSHLQQDCTLMNNCPRKRACEGRHRKTCNFYVQNWLSIYKDQYAFLYPMPINHINEEVSKVSKCFENKVDEMP